MYKRQEAEREVLRRTHADAALTDAEKIAAVKAVYDRLDVPHLTEQQIEVRFERALAQLDELDADPARVEPLRTYAESLLGRKH